MSEETFAGKVDEGFACNVALYGFVKTKVAVPKMASRRMTKKTTTDFLGIWIPPFCIYKLMAPVMEKESPFSSTIPVFSFINAAVVW